MITNCSAWGYSPKVRIAESAREIIILQDAGAKIVSDIFFPNHTVCATCEPRRETLVKWEESPLWAAMLLQ